MSENLVGAYGATSSQKQEIYDVIEGECESPAWIDLRRVQRGPV